METEKALVAFFTNDTKYNIPPQPIMIPVQVGRKGLNDIINAILETNVQFDFIVDSKFLKQTLRKYLDDNKLSTENVLKIEVVETELPPKLQASFQHDDWLSSVAISDNIVTGSFNSVITVWDKFGDNLATITAFEHGVKSVHWVDNQIFVAGDSQHNISGFKLLESTINHQFVAVGHHGSIEDFASNSSTLVTASQDKTIKVWDLRETGKSLNKGKKRQKTEATVLDCRDTLEGHAAAVTAIRINGTNLYSGSQDHSVREWDLTTGSNTVTMNSEKVVLSLDENAGIILTGHDDGFIRLWDPRTKAVQGKLGPHKNMVTGVRHSPKGEFKVCTISLDGTTKIWDTRSRTSLYTVEQDRGKIFALDWSGDILATGGEDAKLNIYQQ